MALPSVRLRTQGPIAGMEPGQLGAAVQAEAAPLTPHKQQCKHLLQMPPMLARDQPPVDSAGGKDDGDVDGAGNSVASRNSAIIQQGVPAPAWHRQ